MGVAQECNNLSVGEGMFHCAPFTRCFDIDLGFDLGFVIMKKNKIKQKNLKQNQKQIK